MKISFIEPAEQIKPYISSFWLYKSGFGISAADARLIVPDGTAKIIIPLKNSLVAVVGEKTLEAKEHKIHLAGLCEKPTKITSDTKDTITLGMEITPKGLYQFFNINMYAMTNRLFDFEDIFGTWGSQLQERLANIEIVQDKISFFQKALVYLLNKNTKNYSLLDHTLDRIDESQGMVNIKELEQQTGYSKRYLEILFKKHIGMSPKRLVSITRFQVFYKLWLQGQAKTFFKDSLYTYYYDQSHFIKDFKRFTGFSPRQFAQIDNEFGRIFYA